jgi:AbrB family looped-hinge helix DNA binding protein
MQTTIDGAGRIVVPKKLRDELRLEPGQQLDLSVRDGRLEIEIPPTPMHLVSRGGVVSAEPEQQLPPLTAEQVRETLEQVRR